MSQDYLQSKDHSVGTILTSFRPFYIPVFQRPYSWTATECQKLWEDIVDFIVQEVPYRDKGPDAPKYFLGAFVVYKEKVDGISRKSVIDGQQRLTTLMLLLKVFYDWLNPRTDRKDPEQDKNRDALKKIEQSLWMQEWSDEKEDIILCFNKPILTSDAMGDEQSKVDFEKIMTSQDFKIEDIMSRKNNSRYAENYITLYNLMEKTFSEKGELPKVQRCHFIDTVLDYCTFLFIEANKEEDALRIFNTLNNRGMQLLDADIFKSELYRVCKDKEDFKKDWAIFTGLSSRAQVIKTATTQLQDEMFRMLMMWVKASKSNSNNDIKLREYFSPKGEGGNYIKDGLLRESLIPLAAFFAAISKRVNVSSSIPREGVELDEVEAWIEKMDALVSDEATKWLQVIIRFNKNAYWRHLVSVYFLNYWQDPNFEEHFAEFLKKSIAFNILYILYDVPFTNIRKKAYELLIEIYANGDFVTNKDLLIWSAEEIINFNYESFAQRLEEVRIKSPFSPAMTLLYAYLNPEQQRIIPNDAQVEHIFPKSWEKHVSTQDRVTGLYGVTEKDIEDKFLEKFGNKVICEAAVNRAACNNYFDFKAGIYQGAFSKKYKGRINVDYNTGKREARAPEKESVRAKLRPSDIVDVIEVSKNLSWGRDEIEARDKKIKETLYNFFKDVLHL